MRTQVSRLMEWAGQEGVCLIPFGGGTSVTRALEVPPLEVEPRPVISVDMRKVFFLRDLRRFRSCRLSCLPL